MSGAPFDVETDPDAWAAGRPRAAVVEPEESDTVRGLRQRVADRQTANALAREYVTLAEGPVLR